MVGVVADRVIVELEAKLDRYNANVVNAQRTFERSMGRMQSSAKRTEGLVATSARNIGGAFATYLGGRALLAGAAGFLSYVDSAKKLDAQLKLATKTVGSFAQAQADVRAIAAATRTDLNSTGTLYANIARNAKDLGLVQSQVAQITTTVAQSFLVSGAAAVEAAQGTRQLVQGLQSGVLRGDEFNTVMEAAPRLARLLADSIGVPIGQLRAMAEAGELTAKTLTTALSDTRFTAGLDAEFKQLPVTFDQAMTLVSNAAQETFSAFDQGGQFSTALANFITSGADGFGDLAGAAEQLGIDIAASMAGLASAFDPMLDGAARVFGSIQGQADGLARAIADVLGAADRINNAGVGVRNFGRRVDNFTNPFGAQRPMLQGSNLQGDFLRGYGNRKRSLTLDSRERAFRRTTVGDPNSFQRFLNEPGRYDALGNPLTPHRATSIPGKAKKGKKGPSAESLAAKAERARLQQEREDEAFRQDLSRFNEGILAAKQALVTAADAVAAYEVQQIEIERQRTESAIAADVVQKKLTAAQAAQLVEANNRLAAAKVEAVQLREQERIRSEAADIAIADQRNDLELAQSGADLLDTRKEQRAVALRIVGLQYELERTELENVIASRDATEAQKEIARRRLAMLGDLESADRAKVERDSRGVGERYRDELNAADINEQLDQIKVDGLKGLEDQLTSTIAKVFELGGAFGNVANQIISDLIRIGVQRAIIGPLANALFGAGTGGTGGTGGIFGQLLGGIFGSGSTSPGGPISVSGPRASGGHVMKGRVYPVNENGIEGFMPGGSGKIIPLGRMNQAGGGGTVVQQTFVLDARYGVTTHELLQHVNEVVTHQAGRAAKASFDASQKATPGRLARLNKLGT